MSKQIFAINTSHGNLSLKAGYVHIKVGGYATIFEDDKDHPDFRDAFSKKWVSYSETEPEASSLPTVKALEFAEPNRGLTAEELKVELAKDKEEKKSAATSEALGQSETTMGEPTVTQFGQDSESDLEPKRSRSKKAAE
jgi:hypothetical protein